MRRERERWDEMETQASGNKQYKEINIMLHIIILLLLLLLLLFDLESLISNMFDHFFYFDIIFLLSLFLNQCDMLVILLKDLYLVKWISFMSFIDVKLFDWNVSIFI